MSSECGENGKGKFFLLLGFHQLAGLWDPNRAQALRRLYPPVALRVRYVSLSMPSLQCIDPHRSVILHELLDVCVLFIGPTPMRLANPAVPLLLSAIVLF